MHTDRLARALCAAAGGDVEVWLFGSRARGDHRPDSDVDLMVVVADDAVDRLDPILQAAAADLARSMATDLTVVTVSRTAFRWPLDDLHPGSVTYACRIEGRRLA